MSQENARPLAVEFSAAQNRSKMDSIVIMHANDLQSVHSNFFVVQHAHSGTGYGLYMFCVAGKAIVISGNKISSKRRLKCGPRLRQSLQISFRSVKKIASDKHHIGSQPNQHGDHASDEGVTPHVSQMGIADQSGHTASP